MGISLLIATQNPGKAAEMAEILNPLGIPLFTLGADEDAVPAEESGSTYRANAEQKALAAARASGMTAISDDSGLEVEALSGRPGLHSARWLEGSQEDRNREILRLLSEFPPERRRARFRCAVAIAHPSGRTWLFEAVLPGRITDAPRGGGGFGYDSIFIPEGEDRTMAEWSPAEKNRKSHRALALQQAMREIEGWVRDEPALLEP